MIKKCSVSSANGYHSSSVANNPESIAVAWGCRGRAQGVKGSYLVLADWKCNENNERDRSKWVLKDAKMVQVDGVKIKENTWYTMKHGEIVEANHNECFA